MIKVLTYSVSGESSSWLVDIHLLAVCWHGEEKAEEAVIFSSSNKDTNPSWPHLNLINSQRLHLLILPHCRLGASTYEFGEVTNISVHSSELGMERLLAPTKTTMERAVDLTDVQIPEFNSRFYHLTTRQPWANRLLLPGLMSVLWRMETKMLSLLQGTFRKTKVELGYGQMGEVAFVVGVISDVTWPQHSSSWGGGRGGAVCEPACLEV